MGINELKMIEMPIPSLKGYDRNPRKNDAVVARMVESIKEFGFRIPVVAKSDGSVVDGHLRLKAAQRMGMKSVPVVLADELTDAQVKAFRLLANRSANWADWDEDLLRLELGELQDMDFEMSLTGFNADELGALLDMDGGTVEGSGVGEPEARQKLSERFGVAPFSVLNAREGWWQERKNAWLALGIRSEIGRVDNALGFSDAANRAMRGKAYPAV